MMADQDSSLVYHFAELTDPRIDRSKLLVAAGPEAKCDRLDCRRLAVLAQ